MDYLNNTVCFAMDFRTYLLAFSSGCTRLRDVMLLTLGQRGTAGFFPFLPVLNSSQFFTPPLMSQQHPPHAYKAGIQYEVLWFWLKTITSCRWLQYLACSHRNIGLPNILQTPREEREKAETRNIKNSTLQLLYEKGKFLRTKDFLSKSGRKHFSKWSSRQRLLDNR